MFLKKLNKAKTVFGKAKLLPGSMKAKFLQENFLFDFFTKIPNSAAKFVYENLLKSCTRPPSRERTETGKTYPAFCNKIISGQHNPDVGVFITESFRCLFI